MKRLVVVSLLLLAGCSSDRIPRGPQGDAIRLGRDLAMHTVVNLHGYAGDGLNCTSCHLNAGTQPYASPWIGLSGIYPEYNERDGKILSLKGRINDCFKRSMNGKPLPEDSAEMNAIVAYIDWLSRDVPKGTRPPGLGLEPLKAPEPPDSKRGENIYAVKCHACHGIEGEGVYTRDGEPFYPALWGNQSFNDGAGMNKLDKAAAFIHANMPQDSGNTLTPQEAYDVAAFVINRPRPHFSE